MKLFTLSTILFILIGSCEHPDDGDVKTDCVQDEQISSDYSKYYIYYSGLEKHGYAKAIKINKDWRSSAKAVYKDLKLSLLLSTYLVENKDELQAESLILSIHNPKLRCYDPINEEQELYANVRFAAVEDDVIETIYDVNLNVINNKIQLDTFDLISNRVAGKFMISFKKNENWLIGPWYNPDSMRIFNGEFHCDIVD